MIKPRQAITSKIWMLRIGPYNGFTLVTTSVVEPSLFIGRFQRNDYMGRLPIHTHYKYNISRSQFRDIIQLNAIPRDYSAAVQG